MLQTKNVKADNVLLVDDKTNGRRAAFIKGGDVIFSDPNYRRSEVEAAVGFKLNWPAHRYGTPVFGSVQ